MSGINILRRLLMKEAALGSGQASGIMSIGDSVRDLAEKRLQSYLMSAQKQGVDIDKFGEQELKYMLEMNKPKPPKVIAADSPEGKGITEALFGKKGEVFSLQGEKLDPNLPISGGTQQGKKINREFFTRDAEGKDDIRKGISKELQRVQKRIDSGVAAAVERILGMKPIDAMKEANSVIGRKGIYKNLSEQDAKKILQDTEDHIFERNIDIDPEDFAGGGVAGMLGERQNYDNGGDVYLPPIKDVEMGLRFKPDNDFPIGYLNEDILKQIIKNPKQGLEDLQLSILKKNYDDKSKLEFMLGKDNAGIRFSKRFAEGGPARQNFAMGRRAFLKMLAGTGAGIAGLKTGITGLGGKKVATEVATEAVKSAGSSAPPPYFFRLVEKIKFMGDKRKTPSYKERVDEYTYKGKDGSDYELVEDLDTGDIQITKDKTGVGTYGDKSFDTIEDRTEMVFKKGKADETTKGKKPPDEYEEYKVEFDQDGTVADATDIDEFSKKELIEEAGDTESLTLKRAGGGVAYMLGQ